VNENIGYKKKFQPARFRIYEMLFYCGLYGKSGTLKTRIISRNSNMEIFFAIRVNTYKISYFIFLNFEMKNIVWIVLDSPLISL
jgi:hypothetical protein